MRVGLFITCLVDVMRPEIGLATARLLEEAGLTVEVPMSQTCCGQPGFNSGDTGAARDLARKFLAEFERFDYVVVPSGSCGGMIRHHFPGLFADDPDLRGRIAAVCSRTWELSSFLHDVIKLDRLPGRFDGALTYHDSCSGLRELGVQGQPRALMALNPAIRITEMKDSRACCGFGGTFAVKYGDISSAIVDEKIGNIRAAGTRCVVMGDLGCMLNIEGRLARMHRNGDPPIRVLHIAQVLVGEGGAVAPAAAAAAGPDAAGRDVRVEAREAVERGAGREQSAGAGAGAGAGADGAPR